MRTWLWLALLIVCNSAFSANSSLLQNIDERLANHDLLHGQFEQKKYLSFLTQPLISKGEFSIQKPNRLTWTIKSPIPSQLIFDDNGIKQTTNGQDSWEASSQQPGIATVGKIIQALMMSDWDSLSEYFDIDGSIVTESWSLSLTPKNEPMAKAIKNIQLQGDSYLQLMTLNEHSGDRTNLTFKWVPLKPL